MLKNEEESTGKVVFTQNLPPGLETGKYTIKIEQTVKIDEKNVNDSFVSSHTFAIVAEGLQLNPATIQSVFPAENSIGDFGETLPHIILNRSTLPWERVLSAALPQDKSKDQASWLALLLFTADDGVPELKTITLGDCFKQEANPQSNLPPNTLSYFDAITEAGQLDAALEYGSSINDQCQAIDIPVDLFNSIAPSINDLKKLAHLRTVSLTNKALSSNNAAANEGIEEEEDYATIIGNRLPGLNQRNTVHLVSLENMGEFLPDENYQSKITDDKKQVRLISLKNWSFNAVAEEIDWTKALENLNQDPITFRVQENPKITNDTLKKAVNFGFCPLPHNSRSGDKTFSWYRGPLAPYHIKQFITTPASCADALNFYNPDTGLFNVAYSSAWQLGRLMTLSNQPLAKLIYNWKKSTKQQAYFLNQQTNFLSKTFNRQNNLNQTAMLNKKSYIPSLMDLFKQNAKTYLASKEAKKNATKTK